MRKKTINTHDQMKFRKKKEVVIKKVERTSAALNSETPGEFDINRLKYGTYYLHETVAPDGYVVPNSDFAFTVEEGLVAFPDLRGGRYRLQSKAVNLFIYVKSIKAKQFDLKLKQKGTFVLINEDGYCLIKKI